MEENKLYYLVEAAFVSQDGTLRGTSLRAYECTITKTKKYNHYFEAALNPTGYMYVMNSDSTITRKKTKVSLKNKYLNSYAEIDTSRTWKYGCRVFTSPELGLFTKLSNIYRQATAVRTRSETALANLKTFDTHLDHYRTFANEHPELVI